ncbi:MAG: glycosyltransferase family 4 protein [Planctomycetes bacterium]|nr:glycosyltransferase family 4 protein [Planctomycetota bacterium]
MTVPSLHELTVGFLIDRWEPARGGAERALARFARHLLGRGARVLAFAERADADAPGEHVRVRTRGLTRVARERRLAERLVAAAESARCDVTIGVRHLSRVDVFWPHGGALVPALRARELARGGDPERAVRGRFRAFLEFERELLGGGARRVVCVSRLVEREFELAYPTSRARLVRVDNGVDLERFRPTLRATLGAATRRELALDGPLIAFAARDPELKGLATLLAALARLRDRPWGLVVAGPRSPARWQRLARELGLAERVAWRAELDPAALWTAADVCAAPTFRDTSGLVILEALACGTPVITTAAAGAAELVVRREQGTVLPRPGDADALAAALAERIEAARAGSRGDVDPEAERELVRSAVLGRGEDAWLAALTEVVTSL